MAGTGAGSGAGTADADFSASAHTGTETTAPATLAEDAILPTPPRESVWEYPRPPALDSSPFVVTIEFGGATIARALGKSGAPAFTVKETTHPPTYYLPRSSFSEDSLVRSTSARGSVCEWKGRATYWDVVGADGRVAKAAAWSYEEPTAAFKAITGFIAVYPSRMDRCTVNGEAVTPQPSDFYGGWVNSWIDGGERGFKGPPGTMGW